MAAMIAAANAALTATGAMRFGFVHDDLMNIHWAATRSWTSLTTDVFRIWEVSPVYRPFAELVLKCGYQAFGMNIIAWRLCYGVLLCIMTASVACAVWMLTRSTVAGAAAGVLAGFHPFLGNLYFSMGFIFDVLACILTCAFLITYIWARCRPAWTWVLPGLLLIFALESKEIAVAALVMAALYELLLSELPAMAPSTDLRDDRLRVRGRSPVGSGVDRQRQPAVPRQPDLRGLPQTSRSLEL